jgi:peptide/nickel transport system permease protein
MRLSNAATFEQKVMCRWNVVYGTVRGLAGTDNARRDLHSLCFRGLPVALVFGLLGTLFTSLLAITISAIGVWYSGWVDELIQRVTDMSMILPTLPIVILVYLLFSKSIWVTLGVVILINTFSSGIKNYRAAFLQIKNAPYIEAARAYGTSNRRLILRFMVPYIMPVLVPQIVIMILVFVSPIDAGILGFDPYIPTWER